MLTKKTWTILLISFLIPLLAAVFFSATKNSKESANNIVLESSVQPAENHENVKTNIDNAAEYAKADSEEFIPETTPLLSHSATPDEDERMIELLEQRRNDPTTVMKIADFSLEEQAMQKEWLQVYKEKGYIESSEVSFDYVESQNELVEFADLSPSSISIALQDIENTKLAEYEYLGAILNKEEDEGNNLASAVKRVYKDKDGQKVFLNEKSVENTQAILVDEFVTDKIKGYPSSRMTYCTETQRCLTTITLITKDKMYEVSAYGDNDSTKEKLTGIVSSLDLPVLEASDDTFIKK